MLISTKNIDFKFISSLKNLAELKISSSSVKNLSGAEGLCNLKIMHLPNIIDVSAINKTKTLTFLRIERCKRLTDFSFLRNNKSIKELYLWSDVDSLSFVPSMKSFF